MDIENILLGVEMADAIIAALAGSAAVSEILPFVKKIKANSALQLVWNVLKLLGTSSKK